jgi:acyl carrier protein
MKPSIEEVLTELTPVFREVLDDDRLVLTTELSAKDVDGWDSFTHTLLIAAVEEQYNISFRLKEIMNFKNVGDMCRAVLQSAQ